MPNFTAGTSFTDGVTNDVTAAKLNALVADAVPTSSLALNSTTGTIATFNSTTGTIATLNSTTGTIATLNSTTPTFLGAITASTNTINVGSGQIYKDASGNVGVANTTPSSFYSGANNLVIGSGSGEEGLTIYGGNASASYLAFADGTTGDQAYRGSVKYDHSVDAMSLQTGAAGRLLIDSSGNVGVGTASPATKLEVVGSIRVSDGNGLQWGNSGNYISGSGASNVVLLATNSSERLRIDSSGNVGIGTASPSAKLHVASTSCDVIIQDSDTARASNPAALLSFWGSDARAGYIGYPSDSNMYINQTNSGAILFLTNSTERLRIDSSGGVTIAGLAGSGSRAVNASAAGLLSAASDASLKEEVVGAHIAGLDEILQIHPKMYRWKDDIANRGDEASVELGFIANDVAPIIPSAAPMGNDGLYGFYDRSITAALVKAVQELSAKVTALEAA